MFLSYIRTKGREVGVTVIKHKQQIRMAEAAFWAVRLGKVPVPVATGWDVIMGEQHEGYGLLRAYDPVSLASHHWLFGNFWQKQRLIQFLAGRWVVLEVMLVGAGSTPDNDHDTVSYYWGVGGVRYRPVHAHLVTNHIAEKTHYHRSSPSGSRIIMAGLGEENNYLAAWQYLNHDQLAHFQPFRDATMESFLSDKVPRPVWPE